MSELRMEQVCKSYAGQAVLQKVSLQISAGDACAVLGPSGAGKTTLARIFLGLEAPDAGRVETGGARFGCVFQEDRLLPGFTARQNLGLVLPRQNLSAALAGLSALGLSGADSTKPACQLSGGQKRRLALVRAMEAPGTALLLDEPFKGLDAENRRAAMAYLQARRKGRTLLLITHEEEEAEALSARIIRLSPVKKPGALGEESAPAAEYI